MSTPDTSIPVRGQPDPSAPGNTERRHAGRLWARFDFVRALLHFRDGRHVEQVDVGDLLAQMRPDDREALLRRCCGPRR